MKKIVLSTVALFIIVFSIASCSIEDDNPITCEDINQDLERLRISIREFAATSVCGDNFECRYIGFGRKACGGPLEYLIYTTSIDTEELEILVADFNEREADYNLNCGVISDCSIPTEPTGFMCENNKCIPVF